MNVAHFEASAPGGPHPQEPEDPGFRPAPEPLVNANQELAAGTTICSRYKVERILGRVDDVIRTPDGRHVVMLDWIFAGLFGLIEAQVVQERLDLVRIRIVVALLLGLSHCNRCLFVDRGLAELRANWVLWILIGLSVAAVTIVIERWLFFRGIDGKDTALIKPVHDKLSEGDVEGATADAKKASSPGARMIAAALESAKRGVASATAIIDGMRPSEKLRLERNLGFRRLPSALFTLFTGIIFFVLVWMLHRRDKRAMKERAEWDPSALPAVREPETVS